MTQEVPSQTFLDKPPASSAHLVPQTLYCEIHAAHLTIGREIPIILNPLEVYMGYRLDPNHKLIGFEGYLGIRERCDLKELVLWPSCPEPAPSMVTPKVLRIVAAPEESGSWRVRTKFEHDLAADSTMAPLIVRLLKRRDQLRFDPTSLPKTIWD
ncbi:MAG: hypothetical protein WC750_05205 [Patescibacteria group bacterium]